MIGKIRITKEVDVSTTKLTLSADKQTIAVARRIADRNTTSISSMFSRYIHAIEQRQNETAKIGPLTQQATGMAKEPVDFDEKRYLQDGLIEKYGFAK